MFENLRHYYEVQTTVPVGDAPREADFVLLRRTANSDAISGTVADKTKQPLTIPVSGCFEFGRYWI